MAITQASLSEVSILVGLPRLDCTVTSDGNGERLSSQLPDSVSGERRAGAGGEPFMLVLILTDHPLLDNTDSRADQTVR